jgi:hypothetical protein
MKNHLRTLGIALAASVASLVGCSVEDASEVSAEENVDVEQTASAATTSGTTPYSSTQVACTTNTVTAARKLAQYKATQALAWILGGPTNPATNPTACVDFNRGADAIREALSTTTAAETMSGINASAYAWSTSTTRCGLPASIYAIDAYGAMFGWFGTDTSINNCLGAGVNEFFRVSVDNFIDASGQKWSRSKFDPEPATLTANLGSTTGATAAAYYTNTPEYPTTVVKFGSSYTTCGTSVSNVGGPCSPVALSAGAQVSTVLVRNGTLCACR